MPRRRPTPPPAPGMATQGREDTPPDPQAAGPPKPAAGPPDPGFSETDERAAFGARLRAARLAAGWPNLSAAAFVAEVDRVGLQRWESGRISPPAVQIAKLVRALNLDPRMLFPRTDSQS